jgi:hypothetical protein
MGLSLDLMMPNTPLCILIVTYTVSHAATEIDYSGRAFVVGFNQPDVYRIERGL